MVTGLIVDRTREHLRPTPLAAPDAGRRESAAREQGTGGRPATPELLPKHGRGARPCRMSFEAVMQESRSVFAK